MIDSPGPNGGLPNEGLREQKKRRTRRALVDAALHLFDERGYDATTVADIARAAHVSTRTFFSYFRSKDDLLFADTDERLEVLWAGLAQRSPTDRPVDALRRIAREILPRTADELMGVHRGERAKLLQARPDLQARGLERLAEAQRQVASHLHASFPGELSAEQSVAVTGALVAVALHGMQNGDSFDRIRDKLLWTLDLMGDSLDRYAEPPQGWPPRPARRSRRDGADEVPHRPMCALRRYRGTDRARRWARSPWRPNRMSTSTGVASALSNQCGTRVSNSTASPSLSTRS